MGKSTWGFVPETTAFVHNCSRCGHRDLLQHHRACICNTDMSGQSGARAKILTDGDALSTRLGAAVTESAGLLSVPAGTAEHLPKEGRVVSYVSCWILTRTLQPVDPLCIDESAEEEPDGEFESNHSVAPSPRPLAPKRSAEGRRVSEQGADGKGRGHSLPSLTLVPNS